MNAATAKTGKKVTWGGGTGIAELVDVDAKITLEQPAGRVKIKVLYPIVDSMGTHWALGSEQWLDARCVDYLN